MATGQVARHQQCVARAHFRRPVRILLLVQSVADAVDQALTAAFKSVELGDFEMNITTTHRFGRTVQQTKIRPSAIPTVAVADRSPAREHHAPLRHATSQ